MTTPAGADAPPGLRIDLHAHSTASDGTATPAEFASFAAQVGLNVVALTDHDTVDGVAAAMAAAAPLGVRVVAGVELSVMDGKDEVHLLGLHLHDVGAIAGALAEFREGRTTRAERMVAAMNARGIPVTMDQVLAQANGGAVGRPHVARAMVAGGWVTDIREAFDKWIGAGGPAYVEKPRLEIAEGVQIVHRAGGVAVWAHPQDEGRRGRFERMAAAGVDGVEVKHPSHSASDMQRIQALADFFGMIPSGGSDWHGAQGGPRALGAMPIPAEWLERQEARAAEIRAAGVA